MTALDIKFHRNDGKLCTLSNGKLIIWNGHLCEGANLTSPRDVNFCLWTRCGGHDVPSNSAHEGILAEVECGECRKVLARNSDAAGEGTR
ncbi:MAG TPA: hypothetical protein VMF90_12185 [Rhizobiaceae bacterium]|nr:hypothetical protein [Rhizobiaceae bacterium]